MLSYKQTKNSRPIAINKENNELIYINKNTCSDEKRLNGKFEPFYPLNDQLIYIVGRRGCGKSTFCNTYIKNYVEATDGRVFIISRFNSDPSINLPPRAMFVPLNELNDVNIEDFKNSLLVFDDIHNSSLTAAQTKKIHSFVLDVMENSRHHNVSALITSHMATNYSKTREILNESNAIVVYPEYSNPYQIERALKVYYGLSNDLIKYIMNTGSRWIYVNKNQKNIMFAGSRWVYINTTKPKYIMTENEIFTY